MIGYDSLEQWYSAIEEGEARVPDIYRLAGGQANRDYSRVFIAKDIGAAGPGLGDLRDPGTLERAAEQHWTTPRKRSMLNSFSRVKEGDLVLLVVGYRPVTIGRVAKDRTKDEEYMYDPGVGLFGHWDLHNVVRVKWADPQSPEIVNAMSELGQIRPRITFSHLNQEHAREIVRYLDDEFARQGYWDRDLKEASLDDEPCELEELAGFRSLPEGVQSALRDVANITYCLWKTNDQIRAWRPLPSEHESVALLVVPLLLALGWSQEQLTLEWTVGRERVDIALFDSARREGEKPVMLLEAKRPLSGLDWARGQVSEYAERVGVNRPVIVTDGYYWALFEDHRAKAPQGELFLPSVHKSADGFFRALKKLRLFRSSD